jgi:hypothetical protein
MGAHPQDRLLMGTDVLFVLIFFSLWAWMAYRDFNEKKK